MDYGFQINVKIDFPEPIDDRYDDIDIERIKDEVINYYKNELDTHLAVNQDGRYIVRGELKYWHAY